MWAASVGGFVFADAKIDGLLSRTPNSRACVNELMLCAWSGSEELLLHLTDAQASIEIIDYSGWPFRDGGGELVQVLEEDVLHVLNAASGRDVLQAINERRRAEHCVVSFSERSEPTWWGGLRNEISNPKTLITIGIVLVTSYLLGELQGP
jgi:hypothetical protein